MNSKSNKSNGNEATPKINPSLQIGEIIENRYQVVTFGKMVVDKELISGGRGYCFDLFENGRLYYNYPNLDNY